MIFADPALGAGELAANDWQLIFDPIWLALSKMRHELTYGPSLDCIAPSLND
jgi:hypothetical protein